MSNFAIATLSVAAYNMFLVILIWIAIAFKYFPEWIMNYGIYWLIAWAMGEVIVWYTTYKLAR